MLAHKQLLLCHGSRLALQNGAFSTSTKACKSYKLVVVGGGAGGCATAAKFSSKLGQGSVAVIEPADMHYYQPMWTMVGGGMKNFQDSGRPMSQVLPKKADWIKQRAVGFDPHNNKVMTEDGQEVNYEFLVVALGLQLNYNQCWTSSHLFTLHSTKGSVWRGPWRNGGEQGDEETGSREHVRPCLACSGQGRQAWCTREAGVTPGLAIHLIIQ